MYEALAGRHRMTVEMLGEFYDEKRDRAYLLVAGLGAFALLKNETGLHQLDRRYRERTPRAGRETVREDRETIRVEILSEGQERIPARQVKSRVAPLKPALSRLVKKADLQVSLFHEPSLRSIEIWTTGPRAQALERALLLLEAEMGGRTDESRANATAIIRHYDLGISPRVKDVRSGKATTRLDRVFKGHLEVLTG
jgi:protein subunit release factor A